MKKILLTLLILSMALLAGCAANRNEQKPVENQTEIGTQENQDEKLTAEAAQLRALSHAELKAEDVTGLRSEYDREDNVYEVEFDHNGWEYEYKIHAVSGAVLSSAQKRR